MRKSQIRNQRKHTQKHKEMGKSALEFVDDFDKEGKLVSSILTNNRQDRLGIVVRYRDEDGEIGYISLDSSHENLLYDKNPEALKAKLKENITHKLEQRRIALQKANKSSFKPKRKP